MLTNPSRYNHIRLIVMPNRVGRLYQLLNLMRTDEDYGGKPSTPEEQVEVLELIERLEAEEHDRRKNIN